MTFLNSLPVSLQTILLLLASNVFISMYTPPASYMSLAT